MYKLYNVPLKESFDIVGWQIFEFVLQMKLIPGSRECKVIGNGNFLSQKIWFKDILMLFVGSEAVFLFLSHKVADLTPTWVDIYDD